MCDRPVAQNHTPARKGSVSRDFWDPTVFNTVQFSFSIEKLQNWFIIKEYYCNNLGQFCSLTKKFMSSREITSVLSRNSAHINSALSRTGQVWLSAVQDSAKSPKVFAKAGKSLVVLDWDCSWNWIMQTTWAIKSRDTDPLVINISKTLFLWW